MENLKFTRKVEFNSEGNFFDDNPEKIPFYEKSYLSINPDLHTKDVQCKTIIIQEVINHLISKFKFNSIKIIDIGSGSTLILRNILDFINRLGLENLHGVAVDISSTILRSSPSYKDIYKLRADARDLPFDDISFNLVLLVDLIEHTKDPDRVIGEALRVANFVVVKTPLELSLYTLLRGGKKRLQELENKYGHIQHFGYKQIKQLVGDNKIVWETYMKIPNRPKPLDVLQNYLIKYRLFSIFRLLFGGFIMLAITKSDRQT